MAELNKLKPLEKQILHIVGPNTTVWRAEDLYNELIKNEVRDLTKPEHFQNFFQNRPDFYTVMNEHIWSKVPPAKLNALKPPKPEMKQPAVEPEQPSKPPPKPPKPPRPIEKEKSPNPYFPANSIFNPVANLINNCPYNIENSVRTCIDSNRYLMFKVDWLWLKLPAQIKNNWGSQHYFDKALYNDPDFLLGTHSCHLKSVLENSPHSDKIARIIVDRLLQKPEQGYNSREFYFKLPKEVQSFLKTPKGLRGFVDFYPALFHVEEESIQLMKVPLFKNDKELNLPYGGNPKNIPDEHQVMLNSIINLMTMSHMDKDNSIVFVFANVDKPYYKLEWVLDRLPKHIKAKFDHHKQLQSFLFKFKQFLVLGKHAQLRKKLLDFPCDKSISLEILKVQHKHKVHSAKEILNLLPSYCSGRLRSVAELQKFCGLYHEFHQGDISPAKKEFQGFEQKKEELDKNFLQENLQEMGQRIQKIQQNIDKKNSTELKRNIDSLASHFRMMSMISSSSASSNSLQDPAVVSYVKPTTPDEFKEMAPIETLDDQEQVLDLL